VPRAVVTRSGQQSGCQMSDDRCQRAPERVEAISRLGGPPRPAAPGVVKLWAWAAEVKSAEDGGQKGGAGAGAGRGRLSVIRHLSSDLCAFACLGLGTGATFERLGPLGCTGCPASTCGLSTWWSTTALGRDLVLRRVSGLDALSGYPDRT